MLTRFILSLVLACLVPCITQGQQINVWRFGDGGGIDFNSGTAVAMPAGPMNAYEACASICDNSGNLLFYTDGTTVWDQTNTIMPNGSGLLAGTSASQTLIIQKPGDCSKYYIFHTGDHMTPADLRYTMVDMCLNGGLGDVVTTQKNVLLYNPCSEKITAVKHANGTDVWVVVHDLGNAQFRSFPVTPAGVGVSVNTTIGSVHNMNCMIGYMKASHSGQKIVLANTFCQIFDMFDFNAATGVVSNHVNLDAFTGNDWYYGIEFSPNDQYLYTSTTWGMNKLYQIDVANPATFTQLANINGNYNYGGLQLGPDGKIYMARGGQNYLDVINNPNTPGVGAGYANAGLMLAPGSMSQMGMINFPPYQVTATPQTQFVNLGADTLLTCNFTPFLLAPPSVCNATYLWQNGSTSPTFTVSQPGTYYVQITNICGSGSDTIVVTANGSTATLSVSGNDTVCPGSPTTLTASGFQTYVWSPSAGLNTTTGSTVQASPLVTTTYTVIGSDICGSDTLQFTVYVSTTLAGSLTGDTILCAGESVQLTAGGGTQYQWISGTTGTTPVVSVSPATTTTYSVVVDDNGTCAADTVSITLHVVTSPAALFSYATSACESSVVFANGSSGGFTYLWDFGDNTTDTVSNPTHEFPGPGDYTVMLILNPNTGCSDTMEMQIPFVGSEAGDVFIPNAFTPNGDMLNEDFRLFGPVECFYEHLLIFDRWGELIFETKYPGTVFWDGRIKNRLVQQDVYVYRLRSGGTTPDRFGTVTVIR